MCDCREGIIERYDADGVKLFEAPTKLHVHNCEYIMRRNELIPQAERLALARVGLGDNGKPQSRFSRVFILTMDKLASEAGI